MVGNSLAETLSSTDTPGGPWKVYGVARRRTPVRNAKVTYIQCDVSVATDTQAKLSTLEDVTHIFWVTSAFDLSMAKHCEINAAPQCNHPKCTKFVAHLSPDRRDALYGDT